MSGHDIHLMLKSKIEALSYVGGINVFDADGNLINASAAWPAPPVNSADRAFFRTFKSDPQSPEMLVEPVYSRITGAWTTVIARKVTGPKGEFLGAIGRGIEPVNFEKFFATVALGPGATIAMHHSDGTLLARYPHVAELIGKNFKTGPAAQRQIFELPRTTSRLTSPIDGEDRLISSRALTNFPLVIIASTTTSAALADWREQIGILITVTGLSVLAIAALLFLVVRKLSQQHRASQAAAVAGKAAPRHRRQQHDARPAAVRCEAASHHLQQALSRDVRPLGRRREAGLQLPRGDRPPQGNRLVRRRRRSIRRGGAARHRAPQRHGDIDARRTFDPGRQRAGAGRRMAGDP